MISYLPAPPLPTDVIASLALLETVLAGGLAGFAFVDPKFNFVRVNTILAAMNDQPPEAHLGRSVRDVVGEAQWAAVAGFYEQALTGEDVLDCEVLKFLPHETHKPRRLFASYYGIRGEDAAVVGVVAILREITGEGPDRWLAEVTARQQREFVHEVLVGVTGGRLIFCPTDADLPAPLPQMSGAEIPINIQGGIRELRQQAERSAALVGIEGMRWLDFETAVGEAAMNTLVHGGGNGVGRVHYDTSAGRLQVWVRDQGEGIALENLPRATLERGFTTAGTMGYGFKMMLQLCDHIYLETGTQGTTVILEQNREADLHRPPPSLLPPVAIF